MKLSEPKPTKQKNIFGLLIFLTFLQTFILKRVSNIYLDLYLDQSEYLYLAYELLYLSKLNL